jgi:hypothetical protein
MIKFFFLIPTLLCIGWFLYLQQNNWTIEEGKKGFIYIIGLSLVVIIFYSLMYLLNHS